jgi:hypothetical protein
VRVYLSSYKEGGIPGMKKQVALLGIMIIVLSSCKLQGNVLPTNNTPANKIATTAAPTATITPESPNFPVAFPMPTLSRQQIQEVADCKIQDLAAERYPENINTSGLLDSFTPISGCDWAVLSYGYAVRNQSDSLSQLGLEAFKKAVSSNYGFALASSLFEYYFGSVLLVQKPGFANQEIIKIKINYTWSGKGEPSQVKHSLLIDQANSQPVISSHTDPIVNNITVDKNIVQSLAEGLDDLLPIDSEIHLLYCTDNFPEWLVSLTFTDGTQVIMKSNSNFMYIGGPWQTQIDSQTYIQYSPAFAMKMANLMEALELPLGEPAGMYCFGGLVFENAFSRFLPPTLTPTPDSKMYTIYTAVAQTVEAQLTQIAVETPTPEP